MSISLPHHSSSNIRESRSFNVKYAGLVPDIRCDIDPSGRTDLLKILDVAENNGHITILGSKAEFKEDAILDVSSDGLKMTSLINQEPLLLVPVHMIASVGYVKEEELNIVPLKIGLNNENFDLAVIYTRTEDIALEICNQMGACFQSVYQESITSVSEASTTTSGFGRSTFNSADPSTYIAGSVSTSTTNSSRRNEELINEYITMISVCLTHSELNSFAILMKRWREGVIPILEFGKKVLEIYGPERKHLLARMKHLLIGISPEDMDQLNKFMLANGITENAANSATSPLLTAETNLTTEDGSLGCDNISVSNTITFSNTFSLLIKQQLINATLPRPEQPTASFDDLSNNFYSSSPSDSNLSNSTTNQRLKLKRLSSNIPSEDEAVEHINHLNMSNSASSARSSQGGPFRSLFSKLRKQSDNGQISNLQVQVGSRVYDAQEIQKLIPQLEEGIEKKDKQLRQSQCIIETHTKKIADLEKEVTNLQRECDKLRSVLQQKAESAASPATPNQKSSHTEDLHTDLQQKAVLPTAEHPENVRSKKMAVSAEPAKLDQHKATLQHHSKSAGSKQLIRDAVQKNDFLRQLAKEQVIELVECMFEMRARAGQWVIQEGEPGDRLFVVAEGQLQVSREGTILGNIGPKTVMGELAILYNCTRTASVQAVSDVSLWVLDRSAFQMITMRLGMERHSQLMNFLNKVSIFENLSEDRISKMADVMDQDYYAGGHHIIREGEKGDTFFVINSGQVRVTQSIEGEQEPREIRILKQGDFFGEKALLGEEVRTANVIAMNPGVEVLTLDRESFLKLIGDLEALKRDYGDSQRRATLSSRAVQEQPPSPTRIAQDNEYAQLQLRQLKRIATLGVGGFGRVELVCINGDKSRTFALKALKKKHIVDTRQQEHIFAERNIMLETKTDWIVRLYTTFRDSKYVYMLLEACLGGELWTTLRDRGHFDDYTARFYVACVLEGLEYLHRKNIVYRDLKPENCLLTQTGYLKLVDFGFAKKLASGRKTWTFCGTPEYVSPEIILNKGHDQAADYWALGIYICELMLGRPPFQASDPMKTYTLILKGIDALDIPNRRIGKTATALVKKLCRDNPGERLGSGSGGVNDIRKHRWFMGFDWEGLRTRALKAPIVPKVSNPADVSNFDNYPPDQDIPPDEFSGWDEGF